MHKPKLGYYLQAPFYRDGNRIMVPFDVAEWSYEFMKHCSRFVCLMNHISAPPAGTSYYPISPQAEVVDLGPLQRHYLRILGKGFDRKLVYETSKTLDAVIVQGPTPLMRAIGNALHPSCLPVWLLVGLFIKSPKEQFRTHSSLRELLINMLKAWDVRNTRKAVRKGLFLGNNPIMKQFYGGKNPFHLVSKGLVKTGEINYKAPKWNSNPLQILFYSRLDPDKHVETLLRACGILKQQIDFRLILAGKTLVPAYEALLQKMVKDMGLEHLVEFRGHIPFKEKEKLFQDTDLYIFNTCATEGFPRTIWEAFANGLPTICSNYPGADLYFKDGENILLFPQMDHQALSNRIIELISNPTLRQNLIEQQYKLLAENTMEQSVRHISTLIAQNLTGEPRISLDVSRYNT